MTRLRAAVLGAALWCGVVVAVSSLVWVVIARAGQGVVPVSQPQADVTASLPVSRPVHQPGQPSAGVTLSQRPSDSSSPSGTPSSTPILPPPSSQNPPPTGPSPQRRSWSGTAGHVVAECRGPSARLVSAYPNAGWQYLIESRGPGQVEVAFSRVGDGRSTTVQAHCVSGVPHFSVDWHEPGDD